MSIVVDKPAIKKSTNLLHDYKMKKIDFKIHVFLYEPLGGTKYMHWLSDIITDTQEVELTDEQYELIKSTWQKEGEKPEFENINLEFKEIFLRLTQPYLDQIAERYREYGATNDYAKKMLSNIGARVTPIVENHDFLEVVKSTFEHGIICDIYENAEKKIVACTNTDIEELSSDAEVIGENAFRGCHKLREVHLPNVVCINSHAFEGCYSLRKIEFSEKLKRIGVGAFESCIYLKDINLPPSVEFIDESAFYACVSLNQDITLSSMTKIGRDAFAYSSVDHLSKNPIYYEDELNQDDDRIRE